jgi:hypothetical protein
MNNNIETNIDLLIASLYLEDELLKNIIFTKLKKQLNEDELKELMESIYEQ